MRRDRSPGTDEHAATASETSGHAPDGPTPGRRDRLLAGLGRRLPGMRRGTPKRNVVVALLYAYLVGGLVWASTAAAVTLPLAGVALGTAGRRREGW